MTQPSEIHSALWRIRRRAEQLCAMAEYSYESCEQLDERPIAEDVTTLLRLGTDVAEAMQNLITLLQEADDK